METDHDSCHEHPLFLSDELHEESCSNCMNTIKDEQAFVCHDCMYYLHKSCFGEPLVIKHFYHPHPLAHINRTAFWCGSCHKFFEFHQCLYCELCDFTMDVRCALLLNNIESEDQSDAHDKNIDVIQHFSHQHPLKSIQITDPDAEVTCFVCCTICLQEQSLYGCISCECSAHESCARLPTEMAHPFHPPHLLSLLPRYHLFLCSCCFSLEYTFHFHCNDCSFHICLECSSQKPKIEVPLTINLPCHPQCSLNLRKPSIFWCESCCKCIQNDWSFSCEACDFHMDIFCAVTPGHQKVIHNIQHSEHEHPLRLTEKSDNSGINIDVNCFLCQERCLQQGQPFYSCIRCDCFAHKSCAELPAKIQHSFHPGHQLTLDADENEKFHCNSCLRSGTHAFRFQCKECSFNLCIKCSFLKPKIRYESHHHLLCFIERFDKSLRCDACETFTKAYNLLDDDYIATQHCVFRCVQCDFSLHLLCGPLPCKIEHEDHGHPLTYMDTVVEDDSGDYYCSLCQEERDPRSQVYYCADCKYIADLTCVIFEVLNILRGDCKDVHFRALGEPEIMVQDSAATSNAKAEVQIKALDSLTLRGIMNTLSEEDEKRLKEFLAHPREVPHELGMSDEISPYTEKNFNQLKERLFPGNLVQEKRITPYELQQKVVIVEGYMIPWNLAPILKDLFSKYGDISNESKLSSVLKGIGFFYLCRVIRSMLATRVTYATEDLLGHWFYVLNVVQRMGFKVDFAMDRLKRVTQAYFGFQASRRDNDILCFIDERKKSLSRELDELKEKLEHFEKHYQQHDTYLRSTKSSFIKECLKDASKLDWKFVGETLL